MAADGPGASLRHLGQLFETGTVSGLSDPQLLQRFLTRHDEAAFEALVRKHGPMVLAVCRRRLSDPNDVDDAFQATFLVLIRRARDLRDPSRLASWLYGVAHKVAERARLNARKRRAHEQKAPPMPADSAHSTPFDDLAAPLHDAIRALPDRYRAPIVLCFLQGRTHEEAARELGWPLGSVKGRLARAKNLLRKKLMRRGISVPAALIASTLARDAAGSVPPALLYSTIKAALASVAGDALTAAAISSSAAALAREVAHMTLSYKLKLAALGIAALALVGGGAGVYALQGPRDSKNPTKPPPSPVSERQRAVATLELLDARSKLARARAKNLLDEYKQLKAYNLRGYFPEINGPMAIGAFDVKVDEKLKALFERMKTVSEDPADQIAAAEAWIRTVRDFQTQAREILPPDTDPRLVDFEIDIAEGEFWLAELKARNPGVEAAPWASEVTKPAEPYSKPEDPEDAKQDQTIREALEHEIGLPFPDQTPLSDVLKFVKSATVSEKLPNGIPIYVDPKMFPDGNAGMMGPDPDNGAGMMMVSEMMMPSAQPSFQLVLEGVPLKTALHLLLSQQNLTYEVRQGLLTITSRPYLVFKKDLREGLGGLTGGPRYVPSDEDWTKSTKGPLYVAYSPLYGLDDQTPSDQQRSAQVEKELGRMIELPFAQETPLKDALSYIRANTINETFPGGVPIYVDRHVLGAKEEAENSLIRMNLAGVRLKTTLNLLLKQVGLVYVVRQGVVIITAPEALKSKPNPKGQNEFLQYLDRARDIQMSGGARFQ